MVQKLDNIIVLKNFVRQVENLSIINEEKSTPSIIFFQP